MSAAFIVPFNQQPFSVAVKTATYTIPAGYYARAIVNLEGAATFTIDAVTALRGTQNSVLGSSVLDYHNATDVGGSVVGQTLYSGSGPTSAAARVGDAFTSVTDQKSITQELRLPTGTVINGTGTWRAVVELYPMIS
jgi:hypothetical protein